MKLYRWLGFVLAIILTACSGLAVSEPTPSPEVAATATATRLPTPVNTSTPEGPLTIEIWLPAEFDPNSGTPAGNILKARLDEFTQRRPDTQVEVRLKALDSPGGMLDSLTAASAAAPFAMPDLVALPRPLLEAAALKGLLRPFDELINPIEDSDWYNYARQMARLQNSTFGLPFAGDALMMVYRTTTILEPPRTLSDTLSSPGPLVFLAADPQALFTLTQYQASGGAVLDEQGRPWLEAAPLTEVLTYYQSAAASGLIPTNVTQYQSNDEVWEAFNAGNADLIVSWASQHLNNILANSAGTPLPTADGQNFTLATGWVWALASPVPEHQQGSVELAEFLSEGDFLARWTTALGYLPPRPSALANWNTATQRRLAAEIVTSAQLIPASDVLNSLSPLLQKATLDVLELQVDPATAAREAIAGVSEP
jgi:multiple sugar transport system substrate-binding protein